MVIGNLRMLCSKALCCSLRSVRRIYSAKLDRTGKSSHLPRGDLLREVAYQQLSCDSGAGDQVGCFESRVFGIGPPLAAPPPASKPMVAK
jgi:hypothetical protein